MILDYQPNPPHGHRQVRWTRMVHPLTVAGILWAITFAWIAERCIDIVFDEIKVAIDWAICITPVLALVGFWVGCGRMAMGHRSGSVLAGLGLNLLWGVICVALYAIEYLHG